MYDNIFPADTCLELHKLSVDHSNRCESGSIFIRHSDTKAPLTPLEKAVDSILVALNDTSPVVEYWSRSCYINIDAHADIDEDTLKQDGVLRCPRNAHVLYMHVSNTGEAVVGSEDRSKRMGPTVVFPKRKVAWGSVSPIPSMNGGKEYVVDVENYYGEDTEQHLFSEGTNNADEMAIVPAKTARLLRFDGRAFHSVPKPPHRYVMSKKELGRYLEGEDNEEDNYWDDEYQDFEEEETDLENMRSVLLFNTWPGASGPRGVLQDAMDIDEDEIPNDVELYSPSYYDYQSQMKERQRQEWSKQYGPEYEHLWCNDVDKWKRVPIDRMSNGDSANEITVPLMGNPSRKGCNIDQDVLHGPQRGTDEIFHHCDRVTLLDLKRDC